MAKCDFPQVPINETELRDYFKDLLIKIFGEENSGGSLNGDNITNITDPGDTNASTVLVESPDASDLATVITLANEIKGDLNTLVTDVNSGLAVVNSLIAELRDTLSLLG